MEKRRGTTDLEEKKSDSDVERGTAKEEKGYFQLSSTYLAGPSCREGRHCHHFKGRGGKKKILLFFGGKGRPGGRCLGKGKRR